MPVIELAHLSEAERRAYVIAANRLAELAGWDREFLAIELQALSDTELDFDLEITSFEAAEIDLLLDEGEGGNRDPADEVLKPSPGPAITQPGDIWQLGRHNLICCVRLNRKLKNKSETLQGMHSNALRLEANASTVHNLSDRRSIADNLRIQIDDACDSGLISDRNGVFFAQNLPCNIEDRLH